MGHGDFYLQKTGRRVFWVDKYLLKMEVTLKKYFFEVDFYNF